MHAFSDLDVIMPQVIKDLYLLWNFGERLRDCDHGLTVSQTNHGFYVSAVQVF